SKRHSNHYTATPSRTGKPNPRAEKPWNGGTDFGANPPEDGGSAGSFSASPTANPVGRQRGSVAGVPRGGLANAFGFGGRGDRRGALPGHCLRLRRRADPGRDDDRHRRT